MHFGRQSVFFARSLYFAANSSTGASSAKHGSPLIGFSAFKLIGGQPMRMTKMRPPASEIPAASGRNRQARMQKNDPL